MSERSIIERAAYGVGRALNAFKAGAAGERPPRRAGFLGATAEAAKWRGGGFSGEKLSAQTRAIQNGWVYSAINEKAIEVSKGKLRVYPDSGPDVDSQPINDHAFLQVLRRPNPLMSTALLWQFTHWWQDLDGQSYWFLAPDEDGELAEIWPLMSSQVNVVPDGETIVGYYEYQANGRIYRIPAEYVCHFKYPNPFDIFRGLSPLVAAMLPSDADTAMARWNGSFFGDDNVMPSAIVNVSSGNPAAPIDQADIDALADELRSDYQAYRRKTVVTNAYQMAVQQLGWSAKDMDFLGGRQATKEEIYHILGYPPGYADKSTESGGTVAYAKFMERIYGLHNLYADEITAKILIPWYGEGLTARFDDVRPINQDMVLREAAASQADMTVNERRKRYWNLPPHPDGDRLPASGAEGAPANGLEDGIHQMLLTSPSNALAENVRALDDSLELRNWQSKAIKALKLGRPAAVAFQSERIAAPVSERISDGLACAETAEDVRAVFAAARKGVIRSWRPWSSYEERLAVETRRGLRQQAEQLLEHLRTSGDANALSDPALWASLRQTLLEALTPTISELAAASARRAAETLGSSAVGLDWALANDAAAQWAANHSHELLQQVELIDNTTREAVGRLVSEWSQTPEGLDGLIGRVEALAETEGSTFGLGRAETIAITAATDTYAQANAAAWEAAGYPAVRYRPAAHPRCRCYLQPWRRPDGSKAIVWYTARDERVCSDPLTTPWGEVTGCGSLHRTIVSEGPDLGQKADG